MRCSVKKEIFIKKREILANYPIIKLKLVKKTLLLSLIFLISLELLFSYMNHLKLFSYGNPFSLIASLVKIEIMKDDLVKISEMSIHITLFQKIVMKLNTILIVMGGNCTVKRDTQLLLLKETKKKFWLHRKAYGISNIGSILSQMNI